MDDICIHCGNGGSTYYLFRQVQLEERNENGGKVCYPIFIEYLEVGKKVVSYPKKKTNMSKKRKENTITKTAARKKS